ncbi:MAG: thiol:disulfide interchange protein [Proteobacteria bacterium]|jgi:thiol:disulfide interchange protein DsbA|nr:thiol:disulfide interchange protein [Pseudomonadota bacterium]MCU0806881.1 thiol:disulfide interchange protein DsbA/DsbL [Candidatus Contendobacter sp.]
MLHSLHRLLLVLLACLFPLAVIQAADSPTPPAFVEGRDYVRVPTPAPPDAPGKIEVVEFFSYTCPHCRNMESAVHDWLKRKPENVTFRQMAVALGASWEPSARAYYAAQALGVLDRIHRPLFDAIQQERRKLNTEDELAAFFAEQGVDQAAFRKAYQSFTTETQLRRSNQLAQRFGVRGVPTFIVGGQYDVRSGRTFEVVDFLIAKLAAPQG